MRLLISDSNILIDIEVAGLTRAMFRLRYTFAVPDILFHEELAEHHGHLQALGLEIHELAPELVSQVEAWADTYRAASRHDLSAMALAQAEACPLLTGDKALRQAAEREDVVVRGTIWLIEELVRARRIPLTRARAAYDKMRDSGRRLPWHEVEASLRRLKKEFDSGNT
ncbi:MAG: DUF3368 domain-containing protein [Rhodocyclaceae bacterium]|jgi:predicted nucleic acid-binding protein|nr:DUF3368 domain-containing protein [Rhodocyclaceae bacterium]